MAQNNDQKMGLSQARRTYLEARNRSINELTLERLKKKWRQKLADKKIQIANTQEILFDEDDVTLTPFTTTPSLTPSSLKNKSNCYFYLDSYAKRCEELLQQLHVAKASELSWVLRKASDFCASTNRFFDTLDTVTQV